ncbi:shikimate dehydrogenase [Jiangella anatolica]|uniref:Shikimate dehydrogenase (NADP(+)) n=1 Tax=Jiangella anatolica TaxID=2670374 RepID=A0A2W2BK35_9ACTN|nr:shikimate dehydrogenase [Jiangella anatolica]PZF85630.1 shikimate dehydrogenase [Jiangella anatolica]
MTGRSVLAGLFGQGVKPSLTPELHEREAQRHGLRYVYKVIDLADAQLSPDRLEQLLRHAIALGFDGLNVTHPVKQAMVPLVDDVTPDVAAIGALNTILITDGATVGHNTDVTGFASAFAQGLPDADLGRVVLLGAGGAGTAVAHALVRLGVRNLAIADPDTSRVGALTASLGGAGIVLEPLTADALPDVLATATGVVNASPVGMAGHPGSPVRPELLHPGLWVADIVYRPVMTALLQHAQRIGCRTLTGAGMAVHQAADAFELITGQPAHREAMFGDLDDLIAAEVENAHLHQELSDERKP